MQLFGFGKDNVFYDMLVEQADAAHRAAQEFHALIGDYDNVQKHVEKIEDIEHEADDLTHQLVNRLDSAFITPLDKEDLRALSGALDDVTDFIEAGTQRLILYRIEAPRPDLEPLVSLLVNITSATVEAVGGLRNLKGRNTIHERLVLVHQIENDADRAFRKALAALFNAEKPDPLLVIKWKEIYDRVEIAVDKCEDVANIIESVVVKYA